MERQNTSLSDLTERDAFLDKLYTFHRKLGTPIKRIPMLGGRELDLYHLFHKVQSFGGSKVVQDRRLWGEVARSFNLPSSVTSASYAIRQHYTKLLEKYEYYVQDPIANNPFDAPVVLPRLQFTAPATPTIKSQSIPLFTQATPTIAQKTTTKGQDSVSVSRLVRSLLSGYPNEVDFSFNVLTILSHQGGMAIQSQPHLLAVMLAHVGIFSEDDPGLESVYHESWYRESSTDFIQFWELTVPEWMFVPLFSVPFTSASYVTTLFNPHTLPTDECVEAHRVTQLAHILRNLSFTESSAQYLAANQAVHRFLLLSANNCLPSIKSLSLDTLANLAPHITLPPHTPHPLHSPHKPSSPCKPVSPRKIHRGLCPPAPSTSDLLLSTMYECVLSQDKMAVLRGVETLGELSWHSSNMTHLLTTPTDVYHRLFQLLLLPDALIILCCLDALYNLTFSSRELAQTILRVEKSVQILVSLLVVDMEHLSKDMLSGVKIFERKTVSQGSSSQNVTSSLGSKKVGSVKTGSSMQIGNVNHKSIKIGNSTIPTISSMKLPTQSQLHSTPLPKVIGTSSAQNFIPVLSVQQLQELLKSLPATPKTNSVSLAGGNVRVNVLSTTPAMSKPVSTLNVQTISTPTGSKGITTTQSSKVTTVAALVSKVQGTALIESLLTTSAGRPLNVGVVDPEQFTRKWLSSCYEECAGSYVSPLEMYSSYLKACSELKGQVKMIIMSEFNTIIKKLFPNSLSTKITLAGTTVFMVAGLAKKATPTSAAKDCIAMVTSATKPINVDAIRGPTSTAGLTTGPTSSKTGLTSVSTVSSVITPKSISVQAANKILNMTTPTLKSGVQRLDSRPASPLTVARRALDLPATEVKVQESSVAGVKGQVPTFSQLKESSVTEVKGQADLLVKPFTATPLINHIGDKGLGPPPAKKVCVESVGNGLVREKTTPPAECELSGRSQSPSLIACDSNKDSMSASGSLQYTPSPVSTPIDPDTPPSQPSSNNSTPSLTGSQKSVSTEPSSVSTERDHVHSVADSANNHPPPAVSKEKSMSPLATISQSDKGPVLEHSTGTLDSESAPPSLSIPMDCDTPPVLPTQDFSNRSTASDSTGGSDRVTNGPTPFPATNHTPSTADEKIVKQLDRDSNSEPKIAINGSESISPLSTQMDCATPSSLRTQLSPNSSVSSLTAVPKSDCAKKGRVPAPSDTSPVSTTGSVKDGPPPVPRIERSDTPMSAISSEGKDWAMDWSIGVDRLLSEPTPSPLSTLVDTPPSLTAQPSPPTPSHASQASHRSESVERDNVLIKTGHSPVEPVSLATRVIPVAVMQDKGIVSLTTKITTATPSMSIPPQTVSTSALKNDVIPFTKHSAVSATTAVTARPLSIVSVPSPAVSIPFSVVSIPSPAISLQTLANSIPSLVKSIPSSAVSVPSSAKPVAAPSSTSQAVIGRTDSIPTRVADSGLNLLARVYDVAETETRPICLWAGCASVRLNWVELFHHVVYTHLPSDHTHPLVCQWVGCSSSAKRMRPSLLYHVQSHHCSPDTPPSPPNVAKTLLRIKQSQPLAEDSESTLTKSVHLTAGLVLRNLARVLPEAKQRLLPYESTLSQVACSNSEASVGVAECLYLINNMELSWQQ